MTVLDASTVDDALSASEWRRVDNRLEREVTFESFPSGIQFVCRVAECAEAADHHPDIEIHWRTIRLALSTHSEGGITQADLDLASQIDGLI